MHNQHRGVAAPSIHHLGIAVESIDDAIEFYDDILGMKAGIAVDVPDEKVRVAMLPAGDSRIELLEASDDASPVAKFLRRRGPGLHHVALKVDDLEATVERLTAAGRRLATDGIRVGAEGYRYVFVHPESAGGVLLELLEEQ